MIKKKHEICKDRRRQKSTKYSDHRTICLTAHTSKVVARVLRRWSERKIEHGLEEQFGFRRGKVTRDVTGILRIISERSLDVD